VLVQARIDLKQIQACMPKPLPMGTTAGKRDDGKPVAYTFILLANAPRMQTLTYWFSAANQTELDLWVHMFNACAQ
jgi:hypothetical protein